MIGEAETEYDEKVEASRLDTGDEARGLRDGIVPAVDGDGAALLRDLGNRGALARRRDAYTRIIGRLQNGGVNRGVAASEDRHVFIEQCRHCSSKYNMILR